MPTRLLLTDRIPAVLDHVDRVTAFGCDCVNPFGVAAAPGLLGYAPAELVGQNALEYIHPEDAPRIQAPQHGVELRVQGAPPSPYAVALLFMLAYGASIGGMATPVGTPPNLIGIALIRETTGRDLTFFQWVQVGLPLALVLLLGAFALLVWLYRPPLRRPPPEPGYFRRQLRDLHGHHHQQLHGGARRRGNRGRRGGNPTSSDSNSSGRGDSHSGGRGDSDSGRGYAYDAAQGHPAAAIR